MKTIAARTLLAVVLGIATTASAGPPENTGDVVGRDLDVIGIEGLGHLGVFDGRRVLECLNEKIPIQKNSFRSFKARTRYWGARRLPGKHRFNRVTNRGWHQRHFRPKFTLAPVYQKGRYTNKRVWNAKTRAWEMKTTLVRARFRCDTFVAFCFKEGIGHEIVVDEILPEVIFRSLEKIR